MRAWIARMTEDNIDQSAIEKAGEILKNGGLAAFPTETVYGLGGNALDAKASEKIYAAKGRPSDNPLIVHIGRMEDLETVAANVPESARKLAAACWPGPLTMIFEKTNAVPLETTGGLTSVAVRYPSNKVANALILAGGGFIAAPSANTSGRPSPTKAEHVIEDLGDKIDCIIDGGDAEIGLESTIVDFTEEIPTILRPGYYNKEMLEKVLGTVRVDPGILAEDSHVRPKAPGMRYKHYAPKADLTIIQGEMERVIPEINRLAAEQEKAGKKVGVICTDETREQYTTGDIKSIGLRAEDETIAHHLFAILRDFDEDGVEVIYSEAFDTPRMGQAIMNRLLKAACHKVAEVYSETLQQDFICGRGRYRARTDGEGDSAEQRASVADGNWFPRACRSVSAAGQPEGRGSACAQRAFGQRPHHHTAYRGGHQRRHAASCDGGQSEGKDP